MFTDPQWPGPRKNKPAPASPGSVWRRTRKRLLSLSNQRRLFGWGQLASRLPLLILWTLIVILALYVILDTNNSSGQPERPEQLLRMARQEGRRTRAQPAHLGQPTQGEPLLISDSSDMKNVGDRIIPLQPSRSPSFQPRASSTTRKSPTSVYSRQGEVFILIVQDEDQRSKMTNQSPSGKQNLYPSSASSSSRHKLAQPDHPNARQRKLTIPEHIRLLIEILDYHRIGYSIDTTRRGLPEQLLLEGANHRDKRRYAVIVIDDFIKYTKLNRWIRDQLDRYCSSNQIGVITYLLDNRKLDHHVPSKRNGTTQGGGLSSDKPPDGDKTTSATKTSSTSGAASTRSTADQFPLTFEPIEQSCMNHSSANCLVDYQVSERTQILRILKSRENFVIRGELAGNVNNLPLMTMASNHITYEPLTWARLREPSGAGGRSRRHSGGSSRRQSESSTGREMGQQFGEPGPSGALTNIVTRHADRRPLHGFAAGRVQRRAVLPNPSEVTKEWFVGETDADDDHIRPSAGEEDYQPYWPDERNSSAGPVSPGDQSSDFQPGDGFATRRRVLSMIDHGLYDGIKRVIFGLTNRHWSNRMLLLDAIEHLSAGQIMTPLERYVQIDIDDIFVGERGTRLNGSDVAALIETQAQLSRIFEGGFQFNLGFSGKYYKRGNPAEQLGDELLLKHAHNFTWFCHFWSHSKAHLMNDSESLVSELRQNLVFARDKNLNLIGHPAGQQYDPDNMPPTYAVAPHHSGVYPIHEELYETWQRTLNVQVTSTEEYPHLRPASGRRGFVHKNIKVLPRQVCGLYTHTIYKRRYPGGFGRLVGSIRGGELFQTILHNPVNIYMTHMSNYANDRLAPYTFSELFKFVREHTNLRLKYAPTSRLLSTGSPGSDLPASGEQEAGFAGSQQQWPQLGPLQLANYYFDLYLNEREPLWTDPCRDKRHLAIWAPRKHRLCQVVPSILIVGPQKTGTTALHSFLKLNPLFRTSLISSQDFEEVQFFNDKHYLLGSDWYFSRFLPADEPRSSAGTSRNDGDGHSAVGLRGQAGNGTRDTDERDHYYFDKSATYFDDPKVPRRASVLLPHASVVILLIDPADRAYSWYQHMRAHGDPVANELSFEQLLTLQRPPEQHEGRQRQRQRRRRQHDEENSTLLRLDTQKRRQQLRNRCLHPGYYSSHLSNWLQYYDSRQIIIIDGEWFKYNPVAVMNRFQLLLRVAEPVDYSRLLAFSKLKGFYCERVVSRESATAWPNDDNDNDNDDDDNDRRNTQLKCLGGGKGRKYEPMSPAARSWLNGHYLGHNKQLAKLLYEIGQPLPTWLDESINQLPLTSNS